MRTNRSLLCCAAPVAAAVCWLSTSTAFAQTVITLDQIESAALRHQPSLAAARAAVARADAQVDGARAAFLPQISLDAGASLSPGGQLIEISDASGRTYLVRGSQAIGGSEAFVPNVRYQAGLTVQGSFYDFGRTSGEVDAARATASAARATHRADRAALQQAVRSGYLDWLAAFELHEVARDEAQQAAARVERVQAFVSEGARPPSDVTIARYHQAAARLDENRARDDLDSARHALERIVGAELPDGARPDEKLLTAAPSPKTNPLDRKIEALQAERRAALDHASAAERTRLPAIAGELQAGAAGQSDQVFPSYRVGVMLSVPLWDGGRSRARASADRAEADALAARIAATRFDRRADAEARGAALQRSADRIDDATDLVRYAREQMKHAQGRYDLGSGTLDEVAEAETRLRDARTELLRAQIARARATMGLTRAGSTE